MKKLIVAEEAAQMLVSFAGLNYLSVDFSWWLWLILFFSPDLSMIGYVLGNKTGAIIYNLFHHKAVAIALFATGFLLNETILQLAGLLLFSHSSFDRVMGYGLKYFDSFQHTHLGVIGKKS